MQVFLLFTFVFFSLLPVFPASSQSVFNNAGSRATGVGLASVTFSDYASPQNNIAGIAGVEHLLMAAGVAKFYNIDGLNTLAFNLIYPAENFVVSVSAEKEGGQYLNVQKLGVAVANKIGFVQMGLKLNYLQYRADEFGSRGALVLDFGGIADLGEKIKIGAHIFNFTQSTLYSDPPELLPVVMKAGISYQPVPEFKMVAEVEKEPDFEPLRKAGLEYEPVAGIFARSGISFDPMKNYFGLGFRKKKLIIDYAFHHHPRLGGVHQLNVGLKLAQK